MRCDQCEHWDIRDFSFSFPEIGECTKAKPLWNCTEWRDVEDDYRRTLKPECESMKMFVQDGSDYTAHLLTKRDFFCAEFSVAK